MPPARRIRCFSNTKDTKDTKVKIGFSFVSIVSIAILIDAIANAGQQPPVAPPTEPVPAVLQNYKPVTAERLKQPEDGNWLMVRRTYDGWGYSPLEQITPANVAPAAAGVGVLDRRTANGHEAAPIVNNGVMFVSTPGNQVIAIDARTGNLLWRYRRPRADGRDRAARHQPRRRALRRQGLLRRRRGRARRARRDDRRRSVDHDGRPTTSAATT